jgi:hypothetical protein
MSVNGSLEKLPERINIDIGRVQDHLADISSRPVVVIVLSSDVSCPQKRNRQRNPHHSDQS